MAKKLQTQKKKKSNESSKRSNLDDWKKRIDVDKTVNVKICKVCRTIFYILGGLFGLVVVFLLISAIIHARINQEVTNKFKADSRFHSVEVGDLEVYYRMFNEDNTNATIVFMSGLSSTNTTLALEPLANRLDAKIIVIDRPGYGLSEDSFEEANLDFIVDYYREALVKIGADGPFTLMPHSISGIYAKYWAMRYPDDVASIIYIDAGSEEYYIEEEGEQSFGTIFMNAVSRFGVMTGLNRLAFDTTDTNSTLVPNYGIYDDGSYKDIWDLALINTMPQFAVSELENNYKNAVLVSQLQVFDYELIPKLFIIPNYTSGDFYEKYYRQVFESMYGDNYEEMVLDGKELMRKNFGNWEDDGNIRFVEVEGPHSVFYYVTDDLADVINGFLHSNE